MVCLGMAFSACEDDAGTKKVYDPNKPIVLTDFYPKEGGIATKMIISGSNFGTDAKQLQVYFNETPAAVINSTGDKVYVIVPRKPGEDCTVSVQVGDNKATFDEHFQYHIQTTLTTMCQPSDRMGEESVRILLDMIERRAGNRSLVLESTLRAGASVAPPDSRR